MSSSFKILITGKDSYIGTSLEGYLSGFEGRYEVDTLDMLDSSWREFDFSPYDAVFHVAGIAHSDSGRILPEKEKLYYAVNTDLTIECAKKAKDDGARAFIFMSSAIVYGESAPIGKSKVIGRDTPPCPHNCYSNSKLLAEKGLAELEDGSFAVVILRPPMIYGKGSKGNYPLLSRLAGKTPVFPYVNNQRSVLYVGNLCEFVRLMIENHERGVFHPQNREYISTSELVRKIRECRGGRMRLIKGFGWLLRLASHITPLVNKAFGSFCYDMSISEYKEDYRKYSLEESVALTEKE